MEVFPPYCALCHYLGHDRGECKSKVGVPLKVPLSLLLLFSFLIRGEGTVLAPILNDLVLVLDPNTCSKDALVDNPNCIPGASNVGYCAVDDVDIGKHLAESPPPPHPFSAEVVPATLAIPFSGAINNLDSICHPTIVSPPLLVASSKGVDCVACELISQDSSSPVHSVFHLNPEALAGDSSARVDVCNFNFPITPTFLVPGPFIDMHVNLISPEALFVQVGEDVRMQIDLLQASEDSEEEEPGEEFVKRNNRLVVSVTSRGRGRRGRKYCWVLFWLVLSFWLSLWFFGCFLVGGNVVADVWLFIELFPLDGGMFLLEGILFGRCILAGYLWLRILD
ncbi:hypothetical protein KFK09_007886 [Dendrobium nobile]|uniref:Uncharacterized protein n=1 Tax=Dendrobium nobile TaxID=94219 RepID=A0A8T3BSZ7_DENNO|nr:hypothetical protein KFK09_007886 [Dendrobium nobile]